MPDKTQWPKIDLMTNAVTLSIEELSVAEKQQLMERLWTDLSHCPTNIPTPDWNGESLSKREDSLREGRASFIGWDDAKDKHRELMK